MKRYIHTILSLSLAMLVSACSFLDEPLKGGYTSEDFYSNKTNAEYAVNAVYNSLYGHTLWIFTDVASDDAVKGGNAGDQADINDIDNFCAKKDNGPLTNFWQHSYETVSRANNVIAFVPGIADGKCAPEYKTRFVAEAKVLRAYTYFQLVNVFGEVPLKLQPQNTSQAIHVKLSTIEEIYAQIDKDLSEAAQVLPTEYAIAEVGHVTKGVALGLLAKSKLFQGQYADCLAAISQIENLEIYDLEPVYADLFKRGGEDSKESMFSLRYANTTTAQLGNNLNVWFAPAAESGYYFNAPTSAFVESFTEKCTDGQDDLRLDASIGRNGKPWFNGLTFDQSWSPTGYLVKKYHEDLPESEAISQSTIPQHLLRYADILLMKAEALTERGGESLALALDPLNKIRRRAGLSDVPTTGQDELRNIIRNERRHELSFEFHRFYDIIRYGKEYTKSVLPDFPWDDQRYYFPLPQSETDANNAIKQ